MPPKPKPVPDALASVLLTVEAGRGRHAVRVIYPDGRSKARCGVVAVAEAERRQMPVEALTCKPCRAWAAGAV